MKEDIYTGFSNYNEINVENRKKAVEDEVELWKEQKEEFKIYRSEWNKSATEDYLPKHPLHVDIELSDACNLKCEMCAHGLGTVKNVGNMSKEAAMKLIDEVAQMEVYSIKFNWRGESTLNKNLPELVKYAKEKGILEVSINTNGLPKAKGLLIETAKNGIDRFIFSVDGNSAETFESIRIGGNYDQLIKNILEVIEWKKQNNSQKPFIRIQMVRSKKNVHEVEKFISFWQDKADDVRISDVMDRGQGGGLSVGDQVTVGRRRCPQPFQRLIVARDGRVSPCCADWNQQYIAGDINKESLMDIWTGKRMTAMRKVQNDVTLDKIDICKNCYVKESFLWETKVDE